MAGPHHPQKTSCRGIPRRAVFLGSRREFGNQIPGRRRGGLGARDLTVDGIQFRLVLTLFLKQLSHADGAPSPPDRRLGRSIA